MSIDSVINKIVRARWSLGGKATKARFGQARATAACRAVVHNSLMVDLGNRGSRNSPIRAHLTMNENLQRRMEGWT
jgi:hypothetical protein